MTSHDTISEPHKQIGKALGGERPARHGHFTRRFSERLKAIAETNTGLSEEEAMTLAVEEVKAVRRTRRRS
ncbi:MAG: hypothetical protein GY929_27070 [Actinomycetia bacterium]|nr:hypothetical protein [Actinomycetes bacterium]MCP5029945.1 hypothetical protein [Actinomycetes bacterium]